jgi:cob(I)alamin adenosyltransferase
VLTVEKTDQGKKIIQLEKRIKKLKAEQADKINRAVERKMEALAKVITEKEGHLKYLSDKIEALRETRNRLETGYGTELYYQEQTNLIRKSLYTASIALMDMAEDSPRIPEKYIDRLKKYADEMRKGAQFVDDFIQSQ